jgi:hypothetical protein
LKNITIYDVYNIEKLNKSNIGYENETIYRPYNSIQAFWYTNVYVTLTVTMLNEHPVMTDDVKTCTRDGWQSIDIVKIHRHVKWNENYHSLTFK